MFLRKNSRMERIALLGRAESHDFLGVKNTELGRFISTPRLKRKRLRSSTPSDGGGGPSNRTDEALQSPLAKRKKLAAERTGYSRLKEGITAEELTMMDETASNGSRRSSPKIIAHENVDDQDGEGDDEEEEEEEDDFLARELEEEWG